MTTDTKDTAMIDTLRQDILAAIDADEMVLPTLPEVALQIREAAADPNISPRDLSQILSRDAALTARLIKVANSPLMRTINTIDSLPMAVSRLGISYTCNLATGLVMEQMFQATSELIDERIRKVWKHSLEVAAIASVLARHYTRLPADQAALAGLVHQIGILPVLSYVEEKALFSDVSESAALEALIEAVHPEIGTLILRTWRFPPQLQEVPVQHVNLQYCSASPDYTDLVIVASLQATGGVGLQSAGDDWQEIPAFRSLGMNTDTEELELDTLSEEVQATYDALS